jgi:tetratricopeptide (TPR) repeat protein
VDADAVSVIASAVSAGAAAGAKETVAQAVKDAYGWLKKLIAGRYKDVDVTAVEDEPESVAKRESLAEHLQGLGAGADEELVAAAQRVLAAVAEHDPEIKRVIAVDIVGLKAINVRFTDLNAKGAGAMGLRCRDVEASGDFEAGQILVTDIAGPPGPSCAVGQPTPTAETQGSRLGVFTNVNVGGNASIAGGDLTVMNQYLVGEMLPAAAFRPMVEVNLSAGLVKLPSPTRTFVGRSDELAKLGETLSLEGRVVLQVLHGLGGIGKSALATQWASLHATEYSLTWWITADTPSRIEEGLAELAVALQPELAGMRLHLLTERAVQWLGCHTGWLLVLDNVSRPADIQWLLSRVKTGRFLVTSRLAIGWHSVTSAVLSLDVLTDIEAAELLARIAGGPGGTQPTRDLDGSGLLCDNLGNLPLAIEQAAAYISNNRITPRRYLERLANSPAAMYNHATEGSDTARTMAKIWRVSLDQIADTPLAKQLLCMLGWYAVDDFPRALLERLPKPALVDQALGRLAAYHLIRFSADGTAVAVHPLVQAVARTADPSDPYRQPDDITVARAVAIRLLAAALPTDADDPKAWPSYRALLPHIAALSEHVRPETDTADTIHIFSHVGEFLSGQGAPARAIPFHRRAYETATREFGESNSVSLMVLGHLATAQRSVGNAQLAITLLEKVADQFHHSLGEDHPATLRWQDELASSHLAQGSVRRATELHERILARRTRALGKEHPAVQQSTNNLALAYSHDGNLARAVQLLEQLLAGDLEREGAEHSSTLKTQLNLAQAYLRVGDLGRAIPMFDQTLDGFRRAVGDDHPFTLASRGHLAAAYQEKGELNRAIRTYEELLSDMHRTIGPEHPYAIVAQNGLAFACKAAGQVDRAIALYGDTLATSQRIHGEGHPSTLGCRANLATAYEWAGDTNKAINSFKEILVECSRVFGEDHPMTLDCANNLAHAYQSANKIKRAILIFESNLVARRRVLGENHPDTLTSWNNLAFIYAIAGDLSQAITLHEQTLTKRQQVLSADHPDIAQSYINLAVNYEQAGQLSKAVALRELAVAQYRRTLGDDARETLGQQLLLAANYLREDELRKAILLLGQTHSNMIRTIGSDDTVTLQARILLGTAYLQAENPGRALWITRELIDQLSRMHPSGPSNNLRAVIGRAESSYKAGDSGQVSKLLANILGKATELVIEIEMARR